MYTYTKDGELYHDEVDPSPGDGGWDHNPRGGDYMINLRKRLSLRNGASVRHLVEGLTPPYPISGEALLDTGWEYCTWNKWGQFCVGPEQPNDYDLIELRDDAIPAAL